MPAKRTSNAAKNKGGSRASRRSARRSAPTTIVGTVRGDIVGVVLVVLAVALLATILVPSTAVVTSAVRDFLALSFGVAAPVVPVALFAFATTFFLDGEEGVPARVALGLGLVVLAVLAMVSLNMADAAAPDAVFEPAAARRSGGYVGGAVAYCLLELVGALVGNIILVIDEVHNIVGAGDAEGSMNAANILKPALSRGEIQVIGATTFAEYRKHIEKDAALERRFQPVTVAEPSIDDSVEILKGVRRYYEDFHGVVIPDDMCRLAVVLSERYITDRFLPDKAIDLIDEACSDVNLKNPDLIRADEVEKEIGDYARERELLASAPPKTGDEYDEQELDRRYERIAELRSREMQLQTELDALRAKGRPELTADNLARIIELWTKIPAASIRADEFEQLAGLGDRLRAHIVGQDQAIDTVCAAIRRNRVGLQAKRKPVSFLFVGGTGVGKTELVKRLADELFHAPESLIRLDMSEYMEKFSVSRMIGSPPGYVGYDEAGQLTEKIRRRPYSVVLFDEIEKAHPDVMNLLLQILDDGRITDAQGRTVNFENTVIIMTTNAGSNTRTGALGFGLSTDDQSRERAQRALNEFLRPEFLNRIDEIVYFNHLTEENFRAIAALMLDEVRAAMAERGMTLHWTPAVIDYLVRKGYSETYGARNLRRTIQRDVEDAIASAIVARRKAAGDIGIDAQDDHITVTINDREVNA